MKNENYSNSEKPLAVIASHLGSTGHDLAKQFARHGYDLIVVASNPSVVEEAQEFKDYGVDAVSFQLDLSTAQGVEQLYGRIIATGRPVEAMVINTGISTNNSQEKILAKKILKNMADRGHGQIFLAGSDGHDDQKEMTESLQEEARGSGVTITSLKKGSREIYFLKQGYEDNDEATFH